MQEIQFDYYRGMEAEQYTFYRIPKVLFTAECFKSLSCEAKVLYGLLLDRMSLSIKNRWFDEEDRVYIIFTVEDVMELLSCSRQKAIKNLAELDAEKGIGLIEKRRLGLGKPNVIYVKNFIIKETVNPENEEKKPEDAENTQKYENHTSRSMKNRLQEVPESNFKKYEKPTSGSMKNRLQEVPESNLKKYEKQTSRSMENEFQEVPKSYSNDTNINKTDLSENEYSETEYNKMELNETGFGVSESIYPNQNLSALSISKAMPDAIEEMEAYRDIIRERISYECFQDERYHRKEDVDELIELMVEVMLMSDSDTLRIAGIEKPVSIIKNRFMKLNKMHIEYILNCLSTNTTKVGNIKAYLLTTLYNASMTISNYYTAEVNHDLYGS
jgi:hypothetical protein